MNPDASLPDAHLFSHDAMNTTFCLRIIAASEEVARGMARECIEHLDYLENRLSRFIDGSDVSRINRLQAGETLYLSEPCHACLRLALDAHARTGGLFDVTLGSRIAHRKTGIPGPFPPLAGNLTLHPDVPAITCEEPGREIDLGGIGKGFALDQLQALLLDWGAEGALLASGASTLLAFGPASWPVDLTGDHDVKRIRLANQALGASGTGIQGNHIVDPRETGEPFQLSWTRVWVTAATAAQADAWSTAVMLMNPEELAAFLTQDEVAQAVYVDRGAKVECWKPLT